MRYHQFLLMTLSAVITARADVIYLLVEEPGSCFLGNVEGIGSIEINSSDERFCLNSWAGGAISFFIPEKYPGLGIETAIEPRLYFLKNSSRNSVFLSAYFGIAYVFSPVFGKGHKDGGMPSYAPTTGLTPGFKIGYKRDIKEWGKNSNSICRLFGEPYFGVSWPLYYERFWSSFDYPLCSFGIRIGIEMNIFSRLKNNYEIEIIEIK